MVKVQEAGLSGPLKRPATVWLAFMVIVKTVVPPTLPTAKHAAWLSTKVWGVAWAASVVLVLQAAVSQVPLVGWPPAVP